MGEFLRDMSLIWLLAHCLVMFLMLFESRLSDKKTFIITGIFALIAIPINISCLYILGAKAAAALVPFTCVLPSYIMYFTLAKNRDLRFLFTFCFSDTIILWILLFTKFLDVVFGIDGYIVMFVSRILLVLLAEFLIYKYVRNAYQKLQANITKGWGIFSLTGILFYIVLLFYAVMPEFITTDYKKSFPFFFLLIILPIMYATIYILIKTQIETADAKQKNEFLSMQVQLSRERIANSIHVEETTRILRHDMRHHMVMIYNYICNNEIEKAKDYTNSLCETVEESSIKRICNNEALNLVLSFYDNVAVQKGLNLQMNIHLPKVLSVAEQDLVVIFSNAIENAINHLSETASSNTICVDSFEDGGSIFIQVKNPCRKSVQFVNGVPISNRKQGSHGLGTKSIIHLVEKYGGIFSFTMENNEFIFRCSIS